MAVPEQTMEQWRAMDSKTLLQKTEELRRERTMLRLAQKTGELKNPLQLRRARRQIARILTVVSERKRSVPS